ncbi:MAG: serine hydroxymethyltransferase [Nitrososphaerota archaeon]|jgi:glycine hydroxymethyltransferase|nr:serine hydroxymethyltransferase [Nitrososphaerota archaeon]MDG6927252.1 serine hydroxymethyltransferase [Nitrososphaerota archaeon]MDG6930390.1 serine hydroxymethyltransferase [Nitrososphaerota archaeon]MDG6932597.1 serine hydroxymethyltransferase [Nitrososphaerota archaeon]MDG6935665.1 serine hydroxymethyltransferase [Nitrososphaerota archaeon]
MDNKSFAKENYTKIFELLKEHHKWFSESLTLIASENVMSEAVKEAVVSDLMSRYAEGWPGDRVYAGCKYIDQIELSAIDLGKKLFDAEFVDVRPIAGVTANLAVYTAFTQPGDTIISLAIPNGGHITYGKKDLGGTAGAVRGLNVENFPFDSTEMNIDVDKTKALVSKLKSEGRKPKMVIFGGSLFLFPHPLKELVPFLKAEGITVMYDGAHVMGLIAGGKFQQPLKEGADVMTGSTHKTLPGPQGGLIVSYDKYAEVLKSAVFPSNVSNHHLHHVAGKAIAFAEMLNFGEDYASAVISNAKKLAESLAAKGLVVLGEKYGYTKSHQVVIDVSMYGGGGIIEKELEESNIIANRNLIPGDIKAGRHFRNPGGLRMGVQEITRLGMGLNEMEEVADILYRVIVKKEDHNKTKESIRELKNKFSSVKYTFESNGEAYKYIKIRI